MFDDTFKLQVKEGSWSYQAVPRRTAYVLQEPLREYLEWLQKWQIIVPLDVDEVEWCNCFVLVQKASGKVWLCLDPTRLNKVLIRPIWGPILNLG